jgi:hypothetical protein
VSKHFSAIRAAGVCACLCLIYALLATLAVRQKSATYDEPLHVATGWLNLYRGDYRLSPDVPPLWEYWMALPLGQNGLNFDATNPTQSMDHRAIAALYQIPPANGIDLVNRARWMSLPLAILLAILIAVWAGQLGGSIAAIAAMTAFAFDPNWLGHGPLAKNDVAFALVFFATAYSVWRVGERPGIGSIIAVLLLPAICLGTKFSGLVVGPAMTITLLVRALSSRPWMKCSSHWPKIGIAAGICLSTLLVAWLGIWAQYRFRYDAGLDVGAMLNDLRNAEVRSAHHVNDPTPQQLVEWKPGLTTQFVLGLNNRHFVPQAWAAGFLYVQTQAGERTAFLLGDVYPGGKWDYFPLAFIFKEPLALLAAIAISIAMGLKSIKRLNWSALAMLIPAGLFLAIAMQGNVNIGLRHVFAAIPFIDVGLGIVVARLWRIGRIGKVTTLVLAIGLATETSCTHPDYISFFNIFCGGERGGLALLGDSNLDWGQDLPLLADWQKTNPNVPLYLDYFGTCDPAAYGIRYINVPGGYVYGPPPRPSEPGIAAISATKLQRLFVIDPAHDFATQFEHARPIQVLGGTIYLFHFPLEKQN